MSNLQRVFAKTLCRHNITCRPNFKFHPQRILRSCYSTEVIADPTPDECEKNYPLKIKNIVDEISKLTLIEVVDLNELLKKTLNIKDAPMAMAAMPVAATTSADDDEVAPAVTKTSFTVKLVGFEPASKVAVIKEVKKLIDGMNLVQAKKFVESVPQVVKSDMGKDEAEELKKTMEAVGATCEIV